MLEKKEKKEKKNLHLRSEEVQEILTNPPAWIVQWGITIIFIITCAVIFLAFLVHYPDFVSAKVIVTTKQPTERIVASYSGPLVDIYIENGDTVNSGQRLAAFRNTARIQDVFELQHILGTIKFNANGFYFPINSTSDLVLGDVESAYIAFEKSYINYDLSRKLQPYTGQLLNNRNSLEEILNRQDDQIEQKRLFEQELKLKKAEFERNKKLFDKGVISQQEYENKEMEYIQMQRNIGNMAISISQLREAISSASQTLKSTNVRRQEEAIQLLTNVSQSYNTLQKAVRDWELQYVLSSSTQGTVSFHAFWGINQFINSGEIVFSILPLDTSVLIGKMTISSQNSGKVTVGQKVLVKLDNFPYQQYGMLLGKVKSISIAPDKEGNYFVYISLPNGAMTSYKNKLPFDQELIGSADIITEDLSVAERIFYKFREVLNYN